MFLCALFELVTAWWSVVADFVANSQYQIL
jgi:hypothetical protein